MKLRYNYRLYPNRDQEHLMRQAGGTVRWLWNRFLRLNQDQYKEDKKFIWYYEMAKSLPDLKKEKEWLNQTYSQVLQEALRDLDGALKFKKNNRGFPKFKKKYARRDSFRYQQNTEIRGNRLHLPKIGDVKIRLHRDLPKYSSVTIYQDKGKWYASFVVEVKPRTKPNQPTQVIGIDVNSDHFATSDGDMIKNPKFLKQKWYHVKKHQAQVSRARKGSSNRRKQIDRLSQITAKIRRRRQNFLHQVSHQIANDGVLVVMETLKIDGMKRNHLTAKAVQDAGWLILFDHLEYKSDMRGGWSHSINQWLPSSKTCNNCGNKKEELDLSERTYECDSCGHVSDRDSNAARNIAQWGLQEFCSANNIAPQELREGPLDVMADILSSDMISATQMKEEAACSLDAQ